MCRLSRQLLQLTAGLEAETSEASAAALRRRQERCLERLAWAMAEAELLGAAPEAVAEARRAVEGAEQRRRAERLAARRLEQLKGLEDAGKWPGGEVVRVGGAGPVGGWWW